MEATMTELRRDTTRVVRAADSGREGILTEHGEPRYKITRARRNIDRKAAAAACAASVMAAPAPSPSSSTPGARRNGAGGGAPPALRPVGPMDFLPRK